VALSNPQKRHLRSLAHHLKPVVMIGQHGLKDSILEELELALDAHELIKVRVSAEDRDDREQMIARLVEASGADLIQTIGHIAVLFRRNQKKPRVALPSA
jgi:RNA-binding protein